VQPEGLLTAREAARRLEIRLPTLYAYVSRGLLRSYRQGIKRQRLYRRAEVEELLRLQPTASGPASDRLPGRKGVWEIPLAESWVRD